MSLTWIDYAIILLLLVSTSIGLIRGFVKEIVSLVIWVIAIVIAAHYSVKFTGLFVNVIQNNALRTGICFVVILISVLLLGMLFSFLLNKLFSYLNLGMINRLLGSVFGLLRGVALIVGLMFVVQLTSLPQTLAWQRATLLPYFTSLSLWLQTFIPEDNAEYLHVVDLQTTTKS